MIFDTLENAASYYCILPELQMAAEFLKQLASAGSGRVEIDGDNIYASLSEYETKLRCEGRPEGHRKYIDVQLLLDGIEQIDVTFDNDALEIYTPYNPEKDCFFVKRTAADATVTLTPGKFAVLFPGDLHQPCIAVNDQPSKVRKVVFKIKVK